MNKETDPQSAPTVKLPQRKSLDLEGADLSALAKAAHILLSEVERFLELPGTLNWAPVAFAALALEKEVMTLTPDLAQPEHADAPLPLYRSCSWEKAIPFRGLWVLLRKARPDPTGCGQYAGGVWEPGPNNAADARTIAQLLLPIVQRFFALALKPTTSIFRAGEVSRVDPRICNLSGEGEFVNHEKKLLPDECDKPPPPHLAPAHRKAYLAFEYAENKNEKCLPDDKAYDFLKQNGIDEKDCPELTDYGLPGRDNWKRYLRKARNVLGEQKYKRGARPSTTRSILGLSQL